MPANDDQIDNEVERDFVEFVETARRRLRRGLIGAVGIDRVDDAVAEALAWAVEHRDELDEMDNPVGYLFRVGQSRVRRPRSVTKKLRLLRHQPASMPPFEPGLPDALAVLPESQRTAVWLAHGCDWTHAEIAEVLGVTTSTVATHVRRGLARLRTEMGVSS